MTFQITLIAILSLFLLRSNAFIYVNNSKSTQIPIGHNNIDRPHKLNETFSRDVYRKLEYISNNLNRSDLNDTVAVGLRGQNATDDLNSVIDIIFRYLQKNEKPNQYGGRGADDYSPVDGTPGAIPTNGSAPGPMRIPIQMTPEEAERNKAVLKNVIGAFRQTLAEYRQEMSGGAGGRTDQKGPSTHPVVNSVLKFFSRILAIYDGSAQANDMEAEIKRRLRRDRYEALVGELEAAAPPRRALPDADSLLAASYADPGVVVHKKPSPKQVWGYATMFVTIICLCALTGALFLSFMKKKYYKMMLQFMIGLAVGSLSGSAVFHLIPQAFNLMENDVHHSYIKKSGTVIGGIYLFLVTEWLIKIFLERRRAKKVAQEEQRLENKTAYLSQANGYDSMMMPEFEKSRKSPLSNLLISLFGPCCRTGQMELTGKSTLPNGTAGKMNAAGKASVRINTAFKPLKSIPSCQSNSTAQHTLTLDEVDEEVGEKSVMNFVKGSLQADDEKNSSEVLQKGNTLETDGEIGCHHQCQDDVEFCQFPPSVIGQIGESPTGKGRARAFSCSSALLRKNSKELSDKGGPKRQVSMFASYEYDDDNAMAITMTPDEMIKTCSHEDGLHFAGQNTVVTLAYMILLGDGLHNFIDGLSIGAAFSQSIVSGVSISLAVIFEEFPHELGDFAILINSGMSVKKAMLCNFVSASTCYLGMFFGILLGENEEISFYIFALAAGMFLYISLVDMMPELNKSIEKANKMGSLASTLVIQYTGVILGLSSMCILAKYGSNISF